MKAKYIGVTIKDGVQVFEPLTANGALIDWKEGGFGEGQIL